MKTNRNPFRIVAAAAVFVLALMPATQAGFEEAMAFLKAGKYVDAAGEFQLLVDESPDYADGHYMLGICFLKTGKLDDAEKSLLKAIEINGDNFLYHYNLANLYQMRGKYSKTVGTLNAAEGLADASQQQLLYKLRGFALGAQKKWEESVADLEKLKTKDGSVLTQLGKAYFTLGETDQAVTTLRKAVQQKPEADSHRLLAEGLLDQAAKAGADAQKKARYNEALEQANLALKANPSILAHRYLVGRAALGAGQYEMAAQAFDDVLQKDPNHCNAMANLGKAFIAKKDWKNAMASLENATACDPGLATAWEGKGFALQKMGTSVKDSDPQQAVVKYEEAIVAYNKALGIKASSAARKGIDTCTQNIDVLTHNLDVAEQEALQAARIKAEEDRVKAEQEKAEEWKQRREDDD